MHSLIGSLTTTFREFTFGPVQIALINPRKVGRYIYALEVCCRFKTYVMKNTELDIVLQEHFRLIK